MIRLGTVGTSAICDKFLTAAKATGRYTLAAAYSRDGERGRAFAQSHGFAQSVTDLEELARQIDAVYIASPNLFHTRQSRFFLERGVHVLCEKPIAISADEYAKTKALADENNLVYLEAIIPRYVKERQAIQQALVEIGPLSKVHIRYHQRSSRLDAFLAGKCPNIFNPALYAGALMDLGVYCVYGAVDLLGMPHAITATADFLRGCDMAGRIRFDYDGFSAYLSYRKDSDGDSQSLFIGKNGTLSINMISLYQGVFLTRNGQTADLSSPEDRITRMQGEALAFADLITKTRNDYQILSNLTHAVHSCMDEIKIKAHIIYKEETT